MVTTMTEENFVVIMKEGRLVRLTTQPTRQLAIVDLDILPHRALHQPPDQQSDQQDQTKHFDAFGFFEKDAVDDRRVFQKAEILLDVDLAFVQGKELLGRPFLLLIQKIGHKNEAAGFLPQRVNFFARFHNGCR